jgi:hypothetical protein
MRNAALYKVLVASLRDEARPDEEIRRFEQHWQALGPHSGFTCPVCFLDKNETHALKSLPEDDGEEPVKCPNCQSLFYVPAGS